MNDELSNNGKRKLPLAPRKPPVEMDSPDDDTSYPFEDMTHEEMLTEIAGQTQEAEDRAEHAAELARIEALKKNTITIGDLLELPESNTKAYVPQLAVPGCVSMLSGDPKAGKSTLALWALGAMTHGQQFLGEDTHKVRVLYAIELSTPVLKQQLKQYPIPSLVGNKEIEIITLENNGQFKTLDYDKSGKEFPVRVPWKNWGEQVTHWRTELERSQAKVIVIDTFSAYAMLGVGEANDPGIVVSRLTTLKQQVFSVNRDIAIVILSHLRKRSDNREPDFADVAGSFGMRAAPDINLLLYRPKSETEDSPVRVLKTEGRLGLRDRIIRLDADGYHLQDKLANPETDIQVRLQEFVTDHPKILEKPDLTIREFASAATAALRKNVSYRQARDFLSLRQDNAAKDRQDAKAAASKLQYPSRSGKSNGSSDS